MAQQSQISSPKRRALNDFSLSICDADNLADYQSYLTSTHTNCLIQLLKSVSIKSFVSTEAAHSTAAFLTVKLFFENFFSTQPLAAPINLHLSSAGGESYSVQTSCQPPLSTASDQPDRSNQQSQTTTLSARRILLEFAIRASLYFANLLICKRFRQRPAPEKVRIIGTQIPTSTVVFVFIR